MAIASVLLFALSAISLRSVTAAPEFIIIFSVYCLYYHALHASIALVRIFRYSFCTSKKYPGITIGGTFVAFDLDTDQRRIRLFGFHLSRLIQLVRANRMPSAPAPSSGKAPKKQNRRNFRRFFD
ncbi:MAG: hypothetical protein MZU97_01120 [Bacillus subtilis]|nr:hypothetical protein [Bacillus subtilis]